jgi:hypothetical protein
VWHPLGIMISSDLISNTLKNERKQMLFINCINTIYSRLMIIRYPPNNLYYFYFFEEDEDVVRCAQCTEAYHPRCIDSGRVEYGELVPSKILYYGLMMSLKCSG